MGYQKLNFFSPRRGGASRPARPRRLEAGAARVSLCGTVVQTNNLSTVLFGHSAGLAPKIGCSGWKRRLQTVTYPPNLVRGDPEMYTSRLRCICAWGQAPSPMAPRSRGVHQKKSTKSHSGPLQPRPTHTPSRRCAPCSLACFHLFFRELPS